MAFRDGNDGYSSVSFGKIRIAPECALCFVIRKASPSPRNLPSIGGNTAVDLLQEEDIPRGQGFQVGSQEPSLWSQAEWMSGTLQIVLRIPGGGHMGPKLRCNAYSERGVVDKKAKGVR